jgi:nucleoside-diphosphate-sugar epimerase
MNVLITGGTGDVGTALSERLISSGHRVVVYDLKNECLPRGSTQRVRPLFDCAGSTPCRAFG